MFGFGKKLDIAGLLASGAIVLDVRSVGEYRVGSVPGSKNIPLDQLQMHIPEITSWKKPIIVVCLSGARSAMAVRALTEAGVEAYNGGSWGSVTK